MRKEVVEAEKEGNQGGAKDHKHVYGIIRQQSCERGFFKNLVVD